MDVLSDILHLLHLKASVFFHASFCGPWSVSSLETNKASFHIIERGTCWLHMIDGSGPVTLSSGDLIFIPHDAKHVISDRSEPPVSIEPGVVSSSESSGRETKIICGYFEFESNLANPILSALPDVVHIKSSDADNSIWLDSLMRFIFRETESESLGSTAVIDKLCDVLFVQIIRTWINKHGSQQGLLAALGDPKLYQALEQFHTDPASPWTVETLAEKAGMSRSAFAKRFQQVMGVTPMFYATHWRMQQAYESLTTTSKSIAQIAEALNYQSEASFRKAFKQHMGVTPGVVRKLRNHE